MSSLKPQSVRTQVTDLWLFILSHQIDFDMDVILQNEQLWSGDTVEGPLRADVKQRLPSLCGIGRQHWDQSVLPKFLQTITACANLARRNGEAWYEPDMTEQSRVFPKTFVHDVMRDALLQCLRSPHIHPVLLRRVLDRDFEETNNIASCWREIANEFLPLVDLDYALNYDLE